MRCRGSIARRTSRREFWDRRADESGVFWDSRTEFWDSSGTVFVRKAKHARKRTEENRGKIKELQSRGVAQPGSAPAVGAGGRRTVQEVALRRRIASELDDESNKSVPLTSCVRRRTGSKTALDRCTGSLVACSSAEFIGQEDRLLYSGLLNRC